MADSDGRVAQAEALKRRTKQMALRVLAMIQTLPRRDDARQIGRQVLRSAMSVAANYRAVCRSRSGAEFKAKLGVVVEEADETLFWLEILGESGIVPTARLAPLMRETGEILAITSAAHRTARARYGARQRRSSSP